MTTHTMTAATTNYTTKILPNSKLQEAFTRICSTDQYRTFQKLMDDDNLGSATALVTRVVIDDTLYRLLETEHEYKAIIEEVKGPSIFDHPEML